jgi:excisionase family DNA binding protein
MRVTVMLTLNGVGVPVELDQQALDDIAAALSPTTADSWPAWMSVDTAARYLDVSPERLRKLQARRAIPYHQEGTGCRVLFCRRDLDNWMGTFRHDANRGAT